MLSETAAEIGAVGSGLGTNLMENFVGAIPIRGLDHQEEGDRERHWESQEPAMSCGSHDWTHQWERG